MWWSAVPQCTLAMPFSNLTHSCVYQADNPTSHFTAAASCQHSALGGCMEECERDNSSARSLDGRSIHSWWLHCQHYSCSPLTSHHRSHSACCPAVRPVLHFRYVRVLYCSCSSPPRPCPRHVVCLVVSLTVSPFNIDRLLSSLRSSQQQSLLSVPCCLSLALLLASRLHRPLPPPLLSSLCQLVTVRGCCPLSLPSSLATRPFLVPLLLLFVHFAPHPPSTTLSPPLSASPACWLLALASGLPLNHRCCHCLIHLLSSALRLSPPLTLCPAVDPPLPSVHLSHISVSVQCPCLLTASPLSVCG